MGLFIYNPRPAPPDAFGKQVLPETAARWYSRWTLSWIFPLLKVGYSRALQPGDLWQLPEPRQCKPIADRLERKLRSLSTPTLHGDAGRLSAYPPLRTDDDPCVCDLCQTGHPSTSSQPNERLKRMATEAGAGESKLTLPRALMATFRRGLWQAGCCQALAMSLDITSPLVTQALLRQITTAHSEAQAKVAQSSPVSASVGLAIALFLMLQGQSLLGQNFHQRSMIIGALMRAAVIDLIGRKSMRLSTAARVEFTSGKLITLLSADASYLDWAVGSFFNVILQPFQIIVGIGLLVRLLGYSALVGLAVLLAATPLQAYLFRLLIDARQAQLDVIETRVSITSELLNQIRGIKFQAWEDHFTKRILACRKDELQHLKRGGWHRATLTSSMAFLPTLAATLTFVTYALTGHKLDVATIFASLQLYNILQTPLSMLPLAFQALSDAYVALGRIGSLLAQPDAPEPFAVDDAAKYAVRAHGDFAFVKGEDAVEEFSFKLAGIDLSIPRGALVCIVGPVGSGKSVLLRSLLGELIPSQGPAVFGGTVGYASQDAHLLAGTIRSNIFLGAEEDHDRLQQVVRDCGLADDLRVMPDGLDTELGSKCMTLSGGQRQRVALARAAYDNSEVVLLDDPLSAVDARTGNHILHQAIFSGVFADRTRLMAAPLSRADVIIVMRRDDNIGRISFQGSFLSLLENPDYQQYLRETTVDAEIASGPSKAAINESSDQSASTPAKLIAEEERSTGPVSWRVYWQYARMMGHIAGASALLALLVGSQICRVGTTVLLGLWTDHSLHGWSESHYISLYAGLGLGQAVLTWAATLSMTFAGIRGSFKAFDRALKRVAHSPLRFFDTTPTGRVLSRLSKDIEQLDDRLSYQWNLLLTNAFSVVGTIGLVIYTLPFLGLVFVPLAILYYCCGTFYNRSSREVKRISAISRSKIYSRFEEQTRAMPLIMAFDQAFRLEGELQRAIDEENRAYLISITLQQWLGMRLDFFSNVLILAIALYGAATRETTSPSRLGVVLTYTLVTTTVLSNLVNLIAIVEQEMNCVERICEYGRLETEGARYQPYDPPPAWPCAGSLIVDDVTLRYGNAGPSTLHGLSFGVTPGEKVGIVGKSGAGKSSIYGALLRAYPSSGKIVIDNVDISDIGLHKLRSGLAVLSQDSLMFSGTIRDNLDPVGCHADANLYDCLRKVGFATPGLLDMRVETDGTNFSAGEKQLLSVARILLKDSHVLIMDEATSSVDLNADRLIQTIVHTELVTTTVLCIAHRLESIAGYDKVLVMDAGHIVEGGHPLALYDEPTSAFRDMCEKAGIQKKDLLDVRKTIATIRTAGSFGHVVRSELSAIIESSRRRLSVDGRRTSGPPPLRRQDVALSIYSDIPRDSRDTYY